MNKPDAPANKNAPANPAGAAPQPNFEEQFAKAPWLDGLQANPVLQRFLLDLAPRIELRSISTHVLEAFINVDVTAEKIASYLQANPYYEDMFMRVIAALGRPELPGINASVVLLGMQRSRNLILAMQLFRSVFDQHPEVSADGKLNFKAETYLKYALKTEEVTQQLKDKYGDIAFAAGLLFDYLEQYAIKKQLDARVLNFISTTYAHGLRAGKVARDLAPVLHDFPYVKHMLAAGMIHDVGKIVMAIFEPTAMDFYEKCAARDVPRPIRHAMERERFGVTHDILGMLCCELFVVFRSVSRGVFFHHDAYLLKKRNPKAFALASLLSLSSNIANAFQAASGMADPILEKWKGPDLKDFKFDMAKLVTIANTTIKKG